jgi:uncharacterized protein
VRTALLDVNVLVALLWPDHDHYEAAHRWMAARGHTRWATTPIVQLGVVRILSNPAVSREALSPAAAITLLKRNLESATHEFWPDTMPISTAIERFDPSLQGHRQLTDAYLLAVASHRKGVFATFDRAVRTLAGESLAAAVEIVGTR